MIKRVLLLISLFSLQSNLSLASVVKTIELSLSDEIEVSISQFAGEGDRILWIPSEYGINPVRTIRFLKSLSESSYEVWLPKLHESYFIPAGRSSYTKLPISDIASLIERSIPDDGRKLFIGSSGRGAVLTLLAINYWQNKLGGRDQVSGLVFMHPNFQAKTPAPGESMEYFPVVDRINMPIFILQPQKSNKVWYLPELVSRLTAAGSQVYTKIIEGVGDGYHVRQDADEEELKKSASLPATLQIALRVLGRTVINDKRQHQLVEQDWRLDAVSDHLQPFAKKEKAPSLVLTDIRNKRHDLASYRGKVVLINFWASWCPPCVEEIPSLGRLQKMFSQEQLVVLTVDVGEERAEVEAFLKDVPTELPVLLDQEGETIKRWKVIAFPTTFVIDAEGELAYEYFGGLRWDSPRVVELLQDLIMR